MGRVDRLSSELAYALDRGATIVTGNQRAARTLRNAYDRACRERGMSTWQPPAILAWESWTQALWQQLLIEGHTTHVLLNGTQEHAVWRAIVKSDSEVSALRNVDSLAALAGRAWRLLCQHNGRKRLSGGGNTNTRTFQRWASEFWRRSQAEEWLSTANIEESLVTILKGRTDISLPGEMMLVGFDGFTPAQRMLVDTLRTVGVSIEESSSDILPQSQMLVECNNEANELRIAARWIRQYLEDHPDAHLAVVVPDLAKERTRIDRVFREVLAPELADIAMSNDVAPYEFSLGIPFARTSMAATALSLLMWSLGDLPIAEVSRLLLSPYFAADETERGGRAEVDAFELREAHLLRPEITLRWLRERLENWQHNGRVLRLLKAVRKLERTADQTLSLGRRSYAAWADAIRQMLDAAEWGAGARETSLEFQTRRKWEGALDELATLDFQSVRVDFHEALTRLKWITEQTMFAAESRDAAVQVMGPLEAAGSRFDALWFLGAGESVWPSSPRSNPLLPWHLQRDLGMPGVDPSRDDEQAERVTRRLARSAETVIFSFASETAKGHQRCSAILNRLHLEKKSHGEVVPAEEPRIPVRLEDFEDITPIPPLPDRVIHGGARILQLQAACGFRAFADIRLSSSELNQPGMGLDSKALGTIIHSAMESFWNEVQSQKNLNSLSQNELNIVIERSVRNALRETSGLCTGPWDESFVDIQRERICSLLKRWSEVERSRPPFTVKMSERKFSDVQIGPLHLDVRVDRVDAGAEGDILIDYKTGLAKPSEWLTDRPDAPQLPLYAVVSQSPLEAVAFAQLRPGKDMTLTGFATDDATLPKPVRLSEAATLEAQVERWHRVLTDLAADFFSGAVQVNPKDYPATCKHCNQRVLCRLNPAILEDDTEEHEAMETEHG
jgi:ATP-dependent helicase/nuclease subunit B